MSYSITQQCEGCTACTKICPVDAIQGVRKEVHVIDKRLCIECGACGRICPKEAVVDDKGKVIPKLKKSEWPKPAINTKLCTACENCVEICPADALSMADEALSLKTNKATLSAPEKCVSCGWCVTHCQFNAIKMEVPK